MKSNFVADGPFRLQKAHLREVSRELEKQYGPEMSRAGWFKWVFLHIRMLRDAKREMRRRMPSSGTFY